MSEAVADDLGSLWWKQAPLSEAVSAPNSKHSENAFRSTELPVLRPGQLWLVELPYCEPKLAPLEYRALSTANVVIFDRALTSIVGRNLPLGSYAEPAPWSDGQPDATSERCLRFARDGWSIARLFSPGSWTGHDSVARIQQLLLNLKTLGDLPVEIFVAGVCGAYERKEVRIWRLDEIVAANSAAQSSTVTIVLDVTNCGVAPHFRVASANGLAG